jgi:hypothetical protein
VCSKMVNGRDLGGNNTQIIDAALPSRLSDGHLEALCASMGLSDSAENSCNLLVALNGIIEEAFKRWV